MVVLKIQIHWVFDLVVLDRRVLNALFILFIFFFLTPPEHHLCKRDNLCTQRLLSVVVVDFAKTQFLIRFNFVTFLRWVEEILVDAQLLKVMVQECLLLNVLARETLTSALCAHNVEWRVLFAAFIPSIF
jgi:hypothetical protein